MDRENILIDVIHKNAKWIDEILCKTQLIDDDSNP
jgi:hypothetical protein